MIISNDLLRTCINDDKLFERIHPLSERFRVAIERSHATLMVTEAPEVKRRAYYLQAVFDAWKDCDLDIRR
jgi:hypothetical protein